MVSALERVIAFNERHRVRKSIGDEDSRPRKHPRLTPDPASQQSSSQSSVDAPTRPPFPRSSPPSGNLPRRTKPDAYTASQPLVKLNEEDTFASFWQGAIICFWGWINPPRRPSSDSNRVVHRCASYEDLPVIWRNEFDTYAYKQGASCIVGYGAAVFESVYEIVTKSPRKVHQCIHICRLRNGRSNLRRGWHEWKTWRRQGMGRSQLEIDLLHPNMDSEVPDGNQIVATIFWLHWSTRHRKVFLVNDIPFCQVPSNEKIHAASLMQGSSTNLKILILGGGGEDIMDDVDLWRQALRVSLGADVILPSSLDKVHSWTSVRNASSVRFENAMFQYLSCPVLDVEDQNVPQLILCLKTRFLVSSLLPMTGDPQEALTRLGAFLEARVPFVKPSWFIQCYKTSSLIELTPDYLLTDRAALEFARASKLTTTETTTSCSDEPSKRDSISENWWDSGLFEADMPVTPARHFSQALMASPMYKPRFAQPKRQMYYSKPGVIVPGWECLGPVPKLLIALTPDVCMTYPSLGASCLEHFPVTNSISVMSLAALALHTFVKTVEAHLNQRTLDSSEIPRPQKHSSLLEELEHRLIPRVSDVRPLISLFPVVITVSTKDKAPSTWKVESLEDDGDVSQTTVITHLEEVAEYQQAVAAIAKNVDLCLRDVPNEEGWNLTAGLDDFSSETLMSVLCKEITNLICERSLLQLSAASEDDASLLALARTTHSLISMKCQKCPTHPSRIRRLVSVEDLKAIPVDEFNTQNVAQVIFHGEGLELNCEESSMLAMLSSLGRWMAPSVCRKLNDRMTKLDARTAWAARNFYNLLDSQKIMRDPDLPCLEGLSQTFDHLTSQVVASDGVMRFIYDNECISLRLAAEESAARLEQLLETSLKTYKACVQAMEDGLCVAAGASEAEKLLKK